MDGITWRIFIDKPQSTSSSSGYLVFSVIILRWGMLIGSAVDALAPRVISWQIRVRWPRADNLKWIAGADHSGRNIAEGNAARAQDRSSADRHPRANKRMCRDPSFCLNPNWPGVQIKGGTRKVMAAGA
jgi:hypothetical protein